MVLYTCAVFLAAFLLFLIQPLIAKIILPWFGGTSAVWNMCMLFFQAALVLGYLYAHWVHERLSARKQATVHTVVLLGSLLVLPVAPNASWKSPAVANPEWHILLLLAVTVGLPYFLLSTTSPLLQAWYARTHAGAVPYRLFALSNFASLMALLSYPLLVEPNLSTRTQTWLWSGAYACFVLLVVAIAWQTRTGGPAKSGPPAPNIGMPARWSRAMWVALPATASILLLAITSYLTRDVAAIPFLWILPLSAYLLSFVICFETPRLYNRAVYLPLLAVALGTMAYMLWPGRVAFKVVAGVALATGSLFVFCMVCHGELVRLKPHPRYLTAFYLMVSLGGAVGGVFVGLMAPTLFSGYYELPIGLMLCVALISAVLIQQMPKHARGAAFKAFKAAVVGCTFVSVIAYAFVLAAMVLGSMDSIRVVKRNFYGQLSVTEADDPDGMGPRRKLVHGAILHGGQFTNAAYRNKPTTYYCPETGLGQALLEGREGVPRHIGVIGLGCGTTASYGRAGDVLRIYEINPAVAQLARTEFSYLRDTKARIEIVMGDGRLSLEREPNQRFDVLAIDAFSGDSIPVHLLTEEAFRTYLRHLAPKGVLAVHISNRYLDLQPVIQRAASRFGKDALSTQFKPSGKDFFCSAAFWVLVMEPGTHRELRAALRAEVLKPNLGFRLWTDDYSSLQSVLK